MHAILRSIVRGLLLAGATMQFPTLCAAQVAPLQPPLDRKAWMVSSPSQPLKLLKKPRFDADYPGPRDYMRVLERFPQLGERGWRANYRGDPAPGFFGDPDSAEMGLRSMGNYIFVMALLSADPAYDPQVSGYTRAHLLARARSCLAYMTRSHVTGDIPCGDGKPWGNHWQSAWWTAKMALGAQLIWNDLTPGERERVERVVVYEANRHLPRKAPGGARADTKSEENAWDTEVLAAALSLFPNHAQAAAWRAKLIEFALNSLSAPQDRTSEALVDGRPLREQVYTENIHADYTIENHGAYHACYMACPLHSLAWGYYALTRAGQPVPQAQFHHFSDVWRRLKPTFLERRFVYMEGKDWPRYAYGLSFIMPALVALQQKYGDADARYVERQRFRAFEEEQQANADGTFFGKRFTRNVMMDRMAEYETDCYANLGVCYLLHKQAGGMPMRAPSAAAFARHAADRHLSPEAGLASVRTPGLFASLAWKRLSGPYPMAFFIPAGAEDAAEWGNNNLLGQISVQGVDARRTLVEHTERLEGEGFAAQGAVRYRMADGSPLYTHEVTFAVHPETGTATVESRFVADADITVTSTEGLRLHVASDFFNGGRRRWVWEGGARTLAFDLNRPQPERETLTTIAFPGRWVNLDNRVGIIALRSEGAGFVLRRSDRRNGPWGSIHYDVLDCPAQETAARAVKPGETILHTRFLLVAGDAARTREEAAGWGGL